MKLFSIVLIIFISLVVYHRWVSLDIFTYSDWQFIFSETLRELRYPSVWNSTFGNGFGVVDFIFWRMPLHILYGIFGAIGFDFNVAEKFLVFWPIIILAPLGSFLLVRKVTGSTISGAIGSLIFTYNSYFLSINTQGHETLTLAFIISVFPILFYIQLLEKRSAYLIFITAILLALVGVYDLRSLYIVIGILSLYLLYALFINRSLPFSRRNAIIAFSPYGILLLLSMYWLLPILATNSLVSNAALGRVISFSEYYTVYHALSLHFPFWTGDVPKWETVQSIPLYFWVFPIASILGLVTNKSNRLILFFGMLAVIGVFFSKQTNPPFGNVFYWMYDHIPGFNAFREASKFYFLIAIGYSVLIGGLVKSIYDTRYLKDWHTNGKYLLLLGICMIAGWNAKPVITGDIKTLFVPYQVPRDFLLVKDYIFQQNESFRTFWIHPSNHWVVNSNKHPQLWPESTINTIWKKNLSNEFAPNTPYGQKVIESLEQPVMDTLFDINSVKYVILHLDDKNTDDFIEKSYGKTRNYYISQMEDIPYLKKVNINTREVSVYENEKFRPRIYITKNKSEQKDFQEVTYSSMNPSHYTVLLKKVRDPLVVNFTDSYHPDWKLSLGSVSWYKVLFNKSYFLSDSAHSESSFGLNEFSINPKDIQKNFPKDQYILNADGSIDMIITLYFRPQAYMYLGVLISVLTLVLSIIICAILMQRRLYEKSR